MACVDRKNRYRKLCLEEPGIPIFCRDWWLDAVCGENSWDVVLFEKGDRIIGSMPFYVLKRLGFTFLIQPPLTQTLGPWIRPSTVKYVKRLGYQKRVMQGLIDQLPEYDQFKMNFHHDVDNWLPFYWHGFQQTTRYTYQLSGLDNEKGLWQGLSESTRREIRKATKRFKLKIRNDLGLDTLWELNRETFGRQGMQVPYTRELVGRLDSACKQQDCRQIWIAEDAQNRYHAAIYVVWDENSAYYLMGGSNPSTRNSGAFSLIIWQAIQQAATVTKQFDFEGSMIESVERFFRGFGARQTPYFRITKTNSKPLKLIQLFRD